MKSNVSYINDIHLSVRNLKVWFPIRGGVLQRIVGYVKAVDGIDFDIPRKKTLGLVGESGCGKTTVAKSILRLVPATSGSVYFEGIDILKADRKQMKEVRRKIQYVPQDPYASLDPRQTIGSALYEAMKIHDVAKHKSEAYEKAIDLLERVGLSEEHLFRFPHELSGGQRQRVAIARALVTSPELLVLDEPTSFLDVSVQASILNLLKDLQGKYGLTYLFISHNLAVIHYMSDVVAVMYLGKLVEIGEKDEIYKNPMHPYTFQLLEAIPIPDPERRKERPLIKGEVPSALNIPSGCRFHPRCPYAMDICKTKEPKLLPRGGNRLVACHLYIDFTTSKVTRIEGLKNE